MQDSGLSEIWTESGLLGDNSVQQSWQESHIHVLFGRTS